MNINSGFSELRYATIFMPRDTTHNSSLSFMSKNGLVMCVLSHSQSGGFQWFKPKRLQRKPWCLCNHNMTQVKPLALGTHDSGFGAQTWSNVRNICHTSVRLIDYDLASVIQICQQQEGDIIHVVMCVWYLIWTWCLINPAGVFIVLFGLSLVSNTVGLVHRRHVMHQSDGLHRLVHSTADGLPHFGGNLCTRSLKVLGQLWRLDQIFTIKIKSW